MNIAISVIDTGLTIFKGLSISLGILVVSVIFVAILAATWVTVAPKVSRFVAEYKRAGTILDEEEAAAQKALADEAFYDPDLDIGNTYG